jgi:hypothetical protein
MSAIKKVIEQAIQKTAPPPTDYYYLYMEQAERAEKYRKALENIRAKEDTQVLWDVARSMCEIAKDALK